MCGRQSPVLTAAASTSSPAHSLWHCPAATNGSLDLAASKCTRQRIPIYPLALAENKNHPKLWDSWKQNKQVVHLQTLGNSDGQDN